MQARWSERVWPGRAGCITTIATGGLLAKTAAAEYTARHFPGFDELLARAKVWRLGDDSVTFTTADGLATCDLVEAVADAARALQR